MAATAPLPPERSYEEFVGLHADRFAEYLRGVLGRQAEGRGGRIGVEDTLQEALLAIYDRWPELHGVHDDERDRRLYRHLRDAAARALRSEYGQEGRDRQRVRVLAFDFDAAHAEDRPIRERELQAAVMGEMVRELAGDHAGQDARASLDRGVLIAGLAALSEAEAVVLLAVDHLEWDQHRLAERLGLSYTAVRQTLFTARKLFYALVRHAVGLEADELERARLAAYCAGELSGAEKREVRRHLRHCQACQDLQREQRVFGRDAVGVLSPLPFVLGAKVLATRSGTKAAGAAGGAGIGLFAQPGAAKAAAAVLSVLGVGVGTAAVLAELRADRVDRGSNVAAPGPQHLIYVTPPPGMTRVELTASPSAKPHRSNAKKHRDRAKTTSSSATSQTSSPSHAQTATPSRPQVTQQPSGQTPAAPKSQSSKRSGDEFFAG